MNETAEYFNKINYIFVPVLLLELAIALFSNIVLLTLIGHSYKSLKAFTSLNILLLSTSLMNLLLSINQIILLVLIFKEGEPVPHWICSLALGLQAMARYGITFHQLAVGYNRYRSTRNPTHWELNLNRVWVTTGLIWVSSLIMAGLEAILYISKESQVDVRTCFWPEIGASITYKLSVRITSLVLIVTSVAATYYYHRKTLQFLYEHRRQLEREMEITLDTQYLKKGMKSTPEGTVVSLIVVLTIHMVTLLLPLLYDVIRIAMMIERFIKTGEKEDVSPTPLLILLACIGLLTTISPFFFLLVSQRFKESLKEGIIEIWSMGTKMCNQHVLHKKVDIAKCHSPSQKGATDLSIFVHNRATKKEHDECVKEITPPTSSLQGGDYGVSDGNNNNNTPSAADFRSVEQEQDEIEIISLGGSQLYNSSSHNSSSSSSHHDDARATGVTDEKESVQNGATNKKEIKKQNKPPNLKLASNKYWAESRHHREEKDQEDFDESDPVDEDTWKTSVGAKAVEDKLVLATANHSHLLQEFLMKEVDEYEEMLASAKALDEIFLF